MNDLTALKCGTHVSLHMHQQVRNLLPCIPDDHIYRCDDLPPLYDTLPWLFVRGIIHDLILSHDLDETPALLDIGANIGDTAAVWRLLFTSAVICVEPDPIFLDALKINAKLIQECIIVNALCNASIPLSSLAYQRQGSQTGSTIIRKEPAVDASQDFASISLEDLFSFIPTQSAVFKSDTDGFDFYILKDLLRLLEHNCGHQFPVIYAEGPSEAQLADKEQIYAWIDLCRDYIAIGYEVFLFTNYGHPYAYCGDSILVVDSCFMSLHYGIQNGKAQCHYFDLILTTHKRAYGMLNELKTLW